MGGPFQQQQWVTGIAGEQGEDRVLLSVLLLLSQWRMICGCNVKRLPALPPTYPCSDANPGADAAAGPGSQAANGADKDDDVAAVRARWVPGAVCLCMGKGSSP